MEKAIDSVKADFKERHKLPRDGTLIFVAPGNEISEVEFGIENIRRGVREFLLKYSSPTSLSPRAPPLENYTTVVSVHKGSAAEQYIRDFVKEKEWLGKVIIVTNEENEHYNAMAASDLGIVYDGQMVGAAAALHLPTMILIEMRMHHQWYHDLFNRYWNSLNIIADNNIYPELIGGETWYGKIADTLAEWYVKPDIRYEMIKKWEYYLKDSLSYKPLNRTVVTTKDLMLSDGQAYGEYKDPFRQVASHIWRDI